MNLRDMQLKKARDTLVNLSMREGVIPSVKDINKKLAERFRYAPPGLPSFRPLMGKKYEVANDIEYNHMLTNIYNDLEDLYECDRENNNEILSSFNYYESEKKRVIRKLNELHNRIDNVFDSLSQEVVCTKSIFENFDDFSKIDFIGDEKTGIPRTTSLIDLKGKYACTDTFAGELISKPLRNAQINLTITSSNKSSKEVSSLNNVLKDTSNEHWTQLITTDSSNGITAELEIELDTEESINKVVYSLVSPRPVDIKLSIVDSDGNTLNLKTINTSTRAEWSVNPTKIKTLKFEITKNEPDAIDQVDYQYYIGANNIGIFENRYNPVSELISKEFPINEPFNSVLLTPDITLPPKTNIKFYIGVNSDGSDTGWVRAIPGRVTDLNLLENSTERIGGDISHHFGSKYNPDLYILTKTRNEPVASSQVIIGDNMWKVKSVGIDDLDEFKMEDLMTTEDVVYKNMDSIIHKHQANTGYSYETYVECDSAQLVVSEISSTNEDDLVLVYVNSIEVEEISGTRNLRLSPGWNHIQIVTVSRSNSGFKLKAFFGEIAKNTRGEREMARRVDIEELEESLYLTQSLDLFAVVGDYIVVNYDPKPLGIEGCVRYMYMGENADFSRTTLRVKASIESNSPETTAKINNYKLLVM